MADLSKIKLNGTEYDLKDAVARSNISALENAGYQNQAQVNSAIATAIGNINQFEVAIVTDLPTTDIDTHTIYFKSNSSSGNNVYDEYMYINNNWELIGSTQVDLSNYLEKTDIANWAKQANKPTYTAAEVGALPDSTVIPAAQVNSDWNATSGVAQILNKPTISSWALAANKPTYTATEVGAVPSSYSSLGLVSRIKNNGSIEISESDSGGEGSASLTMSGSNVILQSSKDLANSSIKLKTNNVENISLSEGQTTIIGVVTPTSDTMAANKQYVDQKFNNITHPVTSVNGATGAVTITATGIGALPDSTVIPTKTSDLTNDSKYLIGTNTRPGNAGSGYLIYKMPYTLSTNQAESLYVGTTSNGGQYLQLGYSDDEDGMSGFLKLSNTDMEDGYTSIIPSATRAITITLPNATGTLALASKVVSSVNGATGAVTVNKLKTTASVNNTEYNLIGTATSNNNTSAVNVYNQNLLSFAKTSSLARLTIGSTATPGVVRIYTSADSASGFTDIKSNASSTNERTITLPDANGTVALTTDIPSVPSWAMASSKPSYTFSELTSHPTTLNDYGITDAYTKTEVDGLVSGVLHYKGAKSTTEALPSSGNTTGDVWHVTANGSEWAWDGSTWQELGTAVDLSGYLQTGDIAAWAKAANKPTYTAAEVGALPDTYTAPVTSVNGMTGAVSLSIPAAQVQSDWNATTGMGVILNKPTIPAATTVTQTLTSGTKIGEVNGVSLYAPEAGNEGITAETDPIFSASPAAGITAENITAWNAKSNFSGSYNDLSDKPTIPTVPTNVSAFTNDSGYLTSYTETDPTVPAWAKAASKPIYTASEVGALPDDTIIPTVPTNVSAFTNDAGYLTSYTETDPTVPAWAKAESKPTYTASEVGAMATTHAANGITSSDISNWNSKTSNTGTVTSVRVQATSPVQSSVNTAQSTSLNTTISLASGYGDTQNPYASKTANYVLAAPTGSNGVPSFRKLVAADLPAIGNITNAGDITATAIIASGDRLIINDESASKVINSSITFGSSTAQYLANNGTWQNVYDDSALAARVAALENLEWATYYSGRSNPSNSQGQNGDIYLQY